MKQFEYFIPEPETIIYNNNVTLRPSCEGQHLVFYIPTNHEDKEIIVLSWPTTLALIISASCIIFAMIVSLFWICYCRKQGYCCAI